MKHPLVQQVLLALKNLNDTEQLEVSEIREAFALIKEQVDKAYNNLEDSYAGCPSSYEIETSYESSYC